jgi:hypothetical protein
VFFAAVLLTVSMRAAGLLSVALAAPLAAYTFVVRAGYPPMQAAGQAVLFRWTVVLVAYLSCRSLAHAPGL